jgi:hypothetical protein
MTNGFTVASSQIFKSHDVVLQVQQLQSDEYFWDALLENVNVLLILYSFYSETVAVVLGRVKDSSSHDSILFAFFAGEREDSSLLQRLGASHFRRRVKLMHKSLKQQKK